MDTVKCISPEAILSQSFTKRFADCVILTKEKKILLQYRPKDWKRLPDVLCNFGGHIEPGENVADALIRELNEETGAVVDINDVTALGAVTEAVTNHDHLIHLHFWHDKNGTITGCYEAEAREFDTVKTALADARLMDYARYALMTCRNKGLII